MAMVKDRLIFENKKIDAVAQRKSNKEQKLRSKESAANKVAEKLKRKKDHFKELDDWAQSAASNRGRNGKDDDGAGGGDKVFNRKRMAADKKYGHGGKKGRFKQNDSTSKQDVSGFNPRGNFAGGLKKTAGGSSGGGASRKGKRARDAGRSRK
jgi:rRNA-processing protein EBP2